MDRANCIGTDPDAFFPNVPGESRRRQSSRSAVAAKSPASALLRTRPPAAPGHPGSDKPERRREEIRQQLAEKKEKAA